MGAFRRLIGACSVAALALVVRPCLAQVPVDLTWEAPAGCPRQRDVQQKVLELLGTTVNEVKNPLRVQGSIETLGERYKLTLLIERSLARGTRVIESDDCGSLGLAAAVVSALLLQKELALGRELSESEIEGTSSQKPQKPDERAPQGAAGQAKQAAALPAPSSERSKSGATPPQQVEPNTWRWLLRVPEMRFDFSTLPKGSLGVGLGLGVKYGTWRALAVGTWFMPQETTASGTYPHRDQFRRRTLDVVGCYGWRLGSVEVAPCALASADDVSASASGEWLISRDQRVTWLSFGGGISGFLLLNRYLSLVITGFVRIPTNRERFLVGAAQSPEQVHELPQASIATALACEWSF